jgi:hypothetical protein
MKNFFVFCSAILFASCVSVYRPTHHNVPQLEEVNDLQVNVSVNNLQVNYAVSNNYFLSLDALYLNTLKLYGEYGYRGLFGFNYTESLHELYSLDFGGGYFKNNLGRSEKWNFSVAGKIGYGSATRDTEYYYGHNSQNDIFGRHNYNMYRFSILSSIGKEKENFDVFYSLRIIYLPQGFVNQKYPLPYYNKSIINGITGFIEPSIKFVYKTEFFRYYFNPIIPIPLSENYDVTDVILGVGIIFNFPIK